MLRCLENEDWGMLSRLQIAWDEAQPHRAGALSGGIGFLKRVASSNGWMKWGRAWR